MAKFINRLVITSNRLPFVIIRDGKSWGVKPGSGGLVTALAPVLQNRGGLWIGWPGSPPGAETSRTLAGVSKKAGYSLKAVTLSDEEIRRYYMGLSNEVIWPLFHDLQSYCNFDPTYWETYKATNRKFAEAVSKSTGPEDFIWVHDYHLMNVAKTLRSMNIRAKIGFFLHIPFPPLDVFVKLPWRSEILRALMEYDLIGFQTLRDRRNFMQCARTFTKDLSVKGKGQVYSVMMGKKEVRVGSFPISIDFNEFAKLAESKEVADQAWYIHEDIPHRQIILGVDRLDYTKGITYRFKAFKNALERYPELRRKVTLVQVVVPSRRQIPVYRDLKVEIERMVGKINGEFTSSGWIPIHYIYRSLKRAELLAYYRTAEIALVTPLKDGMNLVAKEYCASNIEEMGVLILSEFAGSAEQLGRNAVLVNPYDIEGVADAIYTAFKMRNEERKARMQKMRRSVRKYNIYWWVNSYLQAAIAKDLESFPLVESYQKYLDFNP